MLLSLGGFMILVARYLHLGFGSFLVWCLGVWGFCLFSLLQWRWVPFPFQWSNSTRIRLIMEDYRVNKSSHYATLVTLPLLGTCLLKRWNWILEMCISLTEAQYHQFCGMLDCIHYFFFHCILSLQLEYLMTRSNVTQCCFWFSISSFEHHLKGAM